MASPKKGRRPNPRTQRRMTQADLRGRITESHQRRLAASTRKGDGAASGQPAEAEVLTVQSALVDLAEMPGLDQRTQGLHSVSEGHVTLVNDKPWCFAHGAMNKVREDGVWRCQHAVVGIGDGPVTNLCGAGAYLSQPYAYQDNPQGSGTLNTSPDKARTPE